ncbi:MAG: disulfide bond formation protein B, partial [Proteobacteria bacterium]|nr:disulfide bond formation protein B [Pseudomonadota bacterium]
MPNRTPNSRVDDLNGVYLFVSWLVAVGVTFAALSVDSITGESPCYLCWLQRLFMFPLAIILGIA